MVLLSPARQVKCTHERDACLIAQRLLQEARISSRWPQTDWLDGMRACKSAILGTGRKRIWVHERTNKRRPRLAMRKTYYKPINKGLVRIEVVASWDSWLLAEMYREHVAEFISWPSLSIDDDFNYAMCGRHTLPIFGRNLNKSNQAIENVDFMSQAWNLLTCGTSSWMYIIRIG